ncbi:hypothetical protein [Nostoc sp. CHAB 5715]|nr:hypothetical protein [Nostoc sp. CHAB 5715]
MKFISWRESGQVQDITRTYAKSTKNLNLSNRQERQERQES